MLGATAGVAVLLPPGGPADKEAFSVATPRRFTGWCVCETGGGDGVGSSWRASLAPRSFVSLPSESDSSLQRFHDLGLRDSGFTVWVVALASPLP